MKAYAPGLKVVERCRHRCRRLLPITGEVLVRVGDRVEPRDPVAQTRLPGVIVPINLAQRLGVPPAEIPHVMAGRPVGTVVRAGERLAESAGLFGWFRRSFECPIEGTIEVVSGITGQVMLRGPDRPVQVQAYLAGRVVEVVPREGAVIEAETTLVQGIFGIGGEAFGPLRPVCETADQRLTPDRLGPECRGAIVVGGGRVTAEALRAARDLGVAAVITGGIDDQDLRDFLGYDLGVATTGAEKVGLTVIITEGFGDVALAQRTFQLLRSRAGEAGACNGATQIRAGVLRPEVVIPWTGSRPGEASPEPPAAQPLSVGASVRIVRDPWFGVLGTIARLPAEPVVLASGSRARVLEVETAAGERLVVPRANVELIEA
jgi:hypothetical protein